MFGWEENIKKMNRKDYINDDVNKKILDDLKGIDSLHLMESNENDPYITGLEIRTVYKYNPKYGDDKLCKCGHPYHRHFDSYEDNDPVGCKYCRCDSFKELEIHYSDVCQRPTD